MRIFDIDSELFKKTVDFLSGKPCDWVYFPQHLLPLLEKHKSTRRARYIVSRYALKRGLLRPKYLRKLNWRVLDQDNT